MAARSLEPWLAFNVLHSFHGGDGANPLGGVTFDAAGNLYGSTTRGGTQNVGTLFQLMPNDAGWQFNTIYDFDSGQGAGRSSVIADALGNLYGVTDIDNVYELSPSGSGWNFTDLHHITGDVGNNLTMDSQGNLYGASNSNGLGFIFKLSLVQGSWTFTHLYNFTGGDDGGDPFGSVIVDAQGNIYGTCQGGGANGGGTVWVLQQ